jgi:hypothetical protein
LKTIIAPLQRKARQYLENEKQRRKKFLESNPHLARQFSELVLNHLFNAIAYHNGTVLTPSISLSYPLPVGGIEQSDN